MDSGKKRSLKNVKIQNDSQENSIQELLELINPYYILYIMIVILFFFPIFRSFSQIIPNDILEVVSKTKKSTAKDIFLTATFKNISTYFQQISFKIKSVCLFNKDIVAFVNGSYSTQYKSINQSNIYFFDKLISLSKGEYIELFQIPQHYSESIITIFNLEIVDGTYHDFEFIWTYTNVVNVFAHIILRFVLLLSVLVLSIVFNNALKSQKKKKPTHYQSFIKYALSYFVILQTPIYEFLLLYQFKFAHIGEFSNMLGHVFCYFVIGCISWLHKFEDSKYLNDKSVIKILFGIVMLFLVNMCASGNMPLIHLFNGSLVKFSILCFGLLTLILPLNTEPQKPELYTTFYHMFCFYIISAILYFGTNMKTNSNYDIISRLIENLILFFTTILHFPVEEQKYSYSSQFTNDVDSYEQIS